MAKLKERLNLSSFAQSIDLENESLKNYAL